MRWLFLLLLVLNLFYGVWRQQEAPVRAKEIAPASLYKGAQQDIRLLSESSTAATSAGALQDCLYVGGYLAAELLQPLQQRLDNASVGVTQPSADPDRSGLYWLRVSPASRHLLEGPLLDSLSRELSSLKHKIMPCEGIATGG